jgi:phage major head subunit gpT-like protein
MDITIPNLASINIGVTTAYNTQFEAAESFYRDITTETSSTGSDEAYPRLDMIPGMREWIGDRLVHELSLLMFTIKNRTFENTIAVRREQIEDDRYGFLSTVDLLRKSGEFFVMKEDLDDQTEAANEGI